MGNFGGAFIIGQFLSPYAQHFLNLGCIYSKNKMPRGKKFKRAIKDYTDGRYVLIGNCSYWMSKSLADKYENE